ncbi:MAG: hypothetical protein AAF543_00055 [Pseudomonadota bacterium]
MTEHLGRIATRDDIGRNGVRGGASGRRPILASADRQRVSRPLSMVGMALGYIGLVAILSVAPFWHQGMTAHQGQPMACTDFGGSR